MQMLKYVLKRVAYSIVTLFVLVALTFFLPPDAPDDAYGLIGNHGKNM